MRLTVLGSAASYAGPGQACSGHLVESVESSIMLDCGNGTLANLARIRDPLSLDAVFVTHGHIDHFGDIYALQSLLRYAPSGPAAPLDLYAPPGLFDRMGCVLTSSGAQDLREAFRPTELVDGQPIAIGDLNVVPVRVDHVEDTFALIVEVEGSRLCYSADTAPTSRIADAAACSHVLLAEATLPEAYAGKAPHLTAAQAAGIARSAGVRTLVLTHLWPTTSRGDILDEAAAVFDGEIVVAEEMTVVEV